MWANRFLSGALALSAALLVPYPGAGPAAFGRPDGDPISKENLDLPFDSFGSSGEEEELAPEIIVFYGQQYEGDAFVFCCDKSGSMAGSKLRKLQQEVIRDIQGFSDRVQFAVIFFDSEMMTFPTAGSDPASATPGNKGAATQIVLASKSGNMTCAKPALVQSLDFANRATARHKVIIYLSDGWNTCSGLDMTTYSMSILEEVQKRNTQGVHINSIGIGTVVNENFLKQLSGQNNGTFSRVAG